MLLLFFILLQTPSFEVHGKLNVSYTREETGDTLNPFISRFWLHYGIIDLVFHPTANLKVIYSNDFVGKSGYSRFYANFFIPRFKSDIDVGKFSLPFGKKIMDHTSLLEDNIGLGLQREKIGIAITIRPFSLNLSGGIFFPTENTNIKLYAGTISMKPWMFDIGIASLLERYSNDTTIVYREYYEYYVKLFVPTRLSLLAKCIPGIRMDNPILGYAILSEFPFHRLFSPFIEYEFFDPDRNLSANSLSRIVIGMKYTIYPYPARLHLAYYINREKVKENKNNLLLLMLMIFW